MNFLAPCGHPGVPVIGTYVACLTCDGKAQRSSFPPRFQIGLFSGKMMKPEDREIREHLMIRAEAVPDYSKRVGFTIVPGTYAIKFSGMVTHWRATTFEATFIAQGMFTRPGECDVTETTGIMIDAYFETST